MYNVKMLRNICQIVIVIWNIVHEPLVSVCVATSLRGRSMDSFYVKLIILRQHIA